MIKNIIIGKNSFLTKSNIKFLKNCLIYSANKLNKKSFDNLKKFKKVNIIFNNFYPSNSLNKLNYLEFKKFCNLSLEKIFLVLENIPSNKIDKILYTSSSAVYGLVDNINNDKPDKLNRQLYSSFKLAAEKLIMNYSNHNNKKYFIIRLFNTYGNDKDNFSFIEKIIRAKKNKTQIKLINEGISFRDFIHLDDVSKIYNFFLKKNLNNGIYDIGTGKAVLIKDLVKIANIPNNKIKRINKIEEIQNSVADTKKLLSQISEYKFQSVEKYIKKKLNIRKQINGKLNIFKKQNINNYSGVVIYGAGFAGKQIYSELTKNNEDILFFVDDNLKLQNTTYQGIPIISYRNLVNLSKNYKIKKVYLTIPSLNKKSLEKMVKKIKLNFFDVRYLPVKKFLISDKIDIQDFNINQINSILDRKQIKLKKIKKLSNKTILVTGAAGTIGSEICRQLIQQDAKKIIGLDKSEIGIYNQQKKINQNKISFHLLDVNDTYFLDKIIKKYKVQIIFHAAAYKHVNILENNIFAAVKNNILATYNICKLAKQNFCEMIFISTDKAANPISVLGYTKKAAEKVCEHLNSKIENNKKIKIVRFGNVFGSSGSAINNFIDKINSESPIEITSKNASRYFMTVLEACYLVLKTSSIYSKQNIFILNMGKPINILKLAQNLARIKTKINNNYFFRYKEVGLQPGEKLRETLKDKKEILQKKSKEIYTVRNKSNNIHKFEFYFKILNQCYIKGDKKGLIKALKNLTMFC